MTAATGPALGVDWAVVEQNIDARGNTVLEALLTP